MVTIGEAVVKVKPNGPGGKWKSGHINVPSEMMEEISWEEQKVIIAIAPVGKSVDDLNSKIKQYKKLVDIEKEIEKMKREI